jgi:hypothetical protein
MLMDIDPIKAIALISSILTALDKLYTYGKSAYEHVKKNRKNVAQLKQRRLRDLKKKSPPPPLIPITNQLMRIPTFS